MAADKDINFWVIIIVGISPLEFKPSKYIIDFSENGIFLKILFFSSIKIMFVSLNDAQGKI